MKVKVYVYDNGSACFDGHYMMPDEVKKALAGRGFQDAEANAFLKQVAIDSENLPGGDGFPLYDLEAWKTEFREKVAAEETAKLRAEAEANIELHIPLTINATVDWGVIHYDVNMTVDSVKQLVEQIGATVQALMGAHNQPQ